MHIFSPRPLYSLPPSSAPPPPLARLHTPFTSFPSRLHAWCTPPPSPTTLSARASHLALVRVLFFCPLLPPPPRGRGRPHTRAGPGQRAGAGVTGARARAGLAPRGRQGCGAGAARVVCSRLRARRPRQELWEEEEGRELKEQESPLPDPPFFTSSPTRLKGQMAWPPLWPVLFVRQSGNTFHPPFILVPPPLCLWAQRLVCACVRSASQRLPNPGSLPSRGGPPRRELRFFQCLCPPPVALLGV